MVAEDCLRLAWEADRDGRRKLRDSLLTLAVLESGPGDPWAERCRARVVAERPGHYLGDYPNIRLALADFRVIEARERLRIKYPEARVLGLLLTARAARGPYLGRVESLESIVEDLAGPAAVAENVRRDAAEVARGPLSARLRALRPAASGLASSGGAGWSEPGEPPTAGAGADRPEDFAHFYLSVLIAIALLIAPTQPGWPGSSDRRLSGAGGRAGSSRGGGGCRG